MVVIDKTRTMMYGDKIDIAMETIAFLSTINKMKKEDYEQYLLFEEAIKIALKEEPSLINEIKEFAVNMTELFN